MSALIVNTRTKVTQTQHRQTKLFKLAYALHDYQFPSVSVDVNAVAQRSHLYEFVGHICTSHALLCHKGAAPKVEMCVVCMKRRRQHVHVARYDDAKSCFRKHFAPLQTSHRCCCSKRLRDICVHPAARGWISLSGHFICDARIHRFGLLNWQWLTEVDRPSLLRFAGLVISSDQQRVSFLCCLNSCIFCR